MIRTLACLLRLPLRAAEWALRAPDYEPCRWANESHLPMGGEES
jgi:hypothetical protein